MRLNHLAVLLGLTTAAMVSTQLPVQAKTSNYQIQSGTTSLSLDQNLLSSLGLNFSSSADTTTPAAGFDLGFSIIPPSADADVVSTNFTFSYDDTTSAFTPVSGTIEHSGSVAFDVDTTKLTLLSPLEIGDFSIGFDSGKFSITDKFSTGQPLFNLEINSNPVFDGKNLQVTGANVLFSQAFNDVLGNAAGYDLNLTGVKVGEAQISATAVPEPETNAAIAVLMAAGAVAIKRRHTLRKNGATDVKL